MGLPVGHARRTGRRSGDRSPPGPGVTGKLGVIKRSEGSLQATCGGPHCRHPGSKLSASLHRMPVQAMMVIITKSVSERDRADQGSANSRTLQWLDFVATFAGIQDVQIDGW